MKETVKQHLESVRVIDLTAWLSGPFLSMQLAAMGAEVIKVERPGIGDPTRVTVPFAGSRGSDQNQSHSITPFSQLNKKLQGFYRLFSDCRAKHD